MARSINWAADLALEHDTVIPLYHQLKERLRAIATTLEPDTLMPSEKELMEYAGVSRATARKAVADLVHEGLLYAQRGRGTFTARPRVSTALSRPVGFTEVMRRLGRDPGTEILSASELAAPEGVAEQLGLERGTPVVVVERLRLLDGEPCMVETTHLPSSLVPGLLDLDLSGSMYDLIERRFGLVPARGSETILAIAADAQLAARLDVKVGAPLLATARTTSTDAGVPLEYTLRHARADMCSFTVELDRGSALGDTSAVDPLLKTV